MNICPICKRRTQQHSKVILCHSCHAEIHYNCCGLLLSDFENEISAGKWFCRPCVEGFFPFNHFEDDNDFMKCVQAMSHSSNIATGLWNSMKIFNPFDINEDDNEIIEYHGDIDPDRCYFNEYSYKLFKNCNYYTEDSFNKYTLTLTECTLQLGVYTPKPLCCHSHRSVHSNHTPNIIGVH